MGKAQLKVMPPDLSSVKTRRKSLSESSDTDASTASESTKKKRSPKRSKKSIKSSEKLNTSHANLECAKNPMISPLPPSPAAARKSKEFSEPFPPAAVFESTSLSASESEKETDPPAPSTSVKTETLMESSMLLPESMPTLTDNRYIDLEMTDTDSPEFPLVKTKPSAKTFSGSFIPTPEEKVTVFNVKEEEVKKEIKEEELPAPPVLSTILPTELDHFSEIPLHIEDLTADADLDAGTNEVIDIDTDASTVTSAIDSDTASAKD